MSLGSNADATPISAGRLWSGRVLSILPALMLLLDGALKIVKPEFVVKGNADLGYADSVLVPLGIALLCSVVLYLIPRTSVLGAILLTGYLGGAVDANVHAGQGTVGILMPVLFAALLWGGLCLHILGSARWSFGNRDAPVEDRQAKNSCVCRFRPQPVDH